MLRTKSRKIIFTALKTLGIITVRKADMTNGFAVNPVATPPCRPFSPRYYSFRPYFLHACRLRS